MPSVDQVEEGMGGGGLVLALGYLSEADIVDDEKVGSGPGLEPPRVRVVGEAGVKVGEQVATARVAKRCSLHASAQTERLEDMTLAGAGLAGDDEVVVTPHEVQARQLDDEGLVEGRLEGPVECLEGLALDKATGEDTAVQASGRLVVDLGAQACSRKAVCPGRSRVAHASFSSRDAVVWVRPR